MRKIIEKATVTLCVIACFVATWINEAQALEPKLLWKKEFKFNIKSIDLAPETGEVLINLNGKEVFLYDKNGNERFHWGPRLEREAGLVGISKDGKYFVFPTGYTEEYAFKKGINWWEGILVHFYSGQTKKELWNVKTMGLPLIFPDGLSVLVYLYSSNLLSIYNAQGQQIFDYKQEIGLPSIKISPDSNYFALIKDSRTPLMLFKRDGTKVWERGRHNIVASISEGASYISSPPYALAGDFAPDAENTHEGIVYDRNGNIVMHGHGILSGNGSRIAMLSPDKISIIGLPDKKVIKELNVSLWDVIDIGGVTIVNFSHNGRYLVIRDSASLLAVDLVEDQKKQINIQERGRFPRFLLTRDGKYLLIRPGDSEIGKSILYYQLY